MERTALERHAAFFDEDGDGLVGVREAFRGMRSLGLSPVAGAVFAPLVVALLGTMTRGAPGAVSVAEIHRGIHPFDTGAFDDQGHIDQSRVEALFRGGDLLTEAEMLAIVASRRHGRPRRFGGVAARVAHVFARVETHMLFDLAADAQKDGARAIRRRTMERFLDGTLFPLLARRRRIARLAEHRRRARPGDGNLRAGAGDAQRSGSRSSAR